MGKNSLFLLILFVILFGIGEIGARIYQGYIRGLTLEDSIFTPCYRHYFFLGPAFKPGARCSWQAIDRIEVNSLGFRGEEIPIQKETGTFRIATFGGSTSHSGNYPQKLQDSLRDGKKLPFRKVEVVNAAVPTWNTTQSLIQFVTRASYLRPDVIVVYHAINSIGMTDNYWLTNLPQVDYEKYSGFLTQHSQLFVFLSSRWERLWKPDPALAKPAGADQTRSVQVFETDLEHLIVLAKHRGIHVVLVTMALNHDPSQPDSENAKRAGPAYSNFKFAVERVSQFNEVTRNMSAKHGATVVDAARSRLGLDPANFVDLCHFTEKGASELARQVEEKLVGLASRIRN